MKTPSAPAFLLVLLTTGCTLLPVGGHPSSAKAGKLSPMGHGLMEYRAAFHVHCFLSHDSRGTIEEIASAASRLGLDAVILSDHYKPGNISSAPRGILGGILFLPGVEMRGGGGSILSFPLQSDFEKDRDPSDLLKEFHRQGAINVLGHVEEIKDWNLEPFSGFEVYNLHAQFKTVSPWSILWHFLFLCPDAFFESSIETPKENLAAWDRELLRGRHLTALAGHDAHANVRLFGSLGGTVGTYPEILRLFSNHVLATDLSIVELSKAVRAGRTFVVFDFLGDGTGFYMSYGKKGAPVDERAILGDTTPFEKENTLDISLPGTSFQGSLLRVVRDGKTLSETASGRLTMTLPGPGVLRAEVYREKRLWIVSSPIYVTP